MGPIMQERTAGTTLKRAVSKDKVRVKNTENAGPVTSAKKSNKVKKASTQVKNGLPGPGQEKDAVTAVQKGAHSKAVRLKSGASKNTNKLSSPEDERGIRPQLRKHSSSHKKEEKQEFQRLSQCSIDLNQKCGAMGKNRRALSLPLSPFSPGLRQMPAHPLTHSPVPTPEALQQHYNQKEDDTDSASDLSDSERLPILPSPCTPCTPPNLNLRAEVINTLDFPPDFPGPRGTEIDDEDDDYEKTNYSYPDFLPPPFSSWSLRQLAVFLHTEGRGAPRPKPVGPLEKYLERLLKLEWLQIQTVQAESSRPPGTRQRPQGFPSATLAQPPRPHTAPSSRLNSPKGVRQNQRGFPFTPINNPPSPATATRLLVCPHCNIRYPLCNGTCSANVYQRHSRLSPLMERRARPGAPIKRSSSETRTNSNEDRSPGGPLTPVSPSTTKSHLKHMQAAGNARKPSQDGGSDKRGAVRRSRVRANSETDVKKEPVGFKATSAEKHAFAASKREILTTKKVEKDWQKGEAAGQPAKTTTKRVAKDPQSSKAPLSSKNNGKTKNVHFVSK
ncbi:uncharacterized protein fam217ba [Eucyclogobius newberryi]|uniref:uncharacterized protein fam217ba n=1 Tax=Eucyclogobius newberryi TaxID=166745 RepID=UPI003B5B12A1